MAMDIHSTRQRIVSGGIDQFQCLIKVFVLENVSLHTASNEKSTAEENSLTVITGPNISSTIVIDLGSFVKMTVGWTKYPFESSPVPPISTSPPASLAFLIYPVILSYEGRLLR